MINKVKKPIFVSLVSDTTFKYMFKNEKTKKWFTDIIRSKTGIDLEDYILIDNEINTGSNIKDYRTDLLLSDNKNNVIIEMNSNYSISGEIKGRQYLFRKAGNSFIKGEKFTDKKTTLIMLNDYKKKDYEGYKIINSWFGSYEPNIKYNDIEMFEIFLPNFHKMCYDECNEIDKRLWLFGAKSYEEMYKYVKSDPNLYIIQELERLGMNNEFVDEYDRELINKKMMNSMKYEGYQEGKTDGEKATKIEIAKNLLQDNLDIKLISKYTGLTDEEISNLS